MRKYNSLLMIIGVCAFFALMLSGFIWLFGVCGISWSILNTLSSVARLILVICALVTGWLWLITTRMNKTAKIVLEVLFIIFAVCAICGVFGVGI